MFIPRGFIPGKIYLDEVLDGTIPFSKLVVSTTTLDNNAITNSGGTIYFDNENLSTTGKLNAGAATFTSCNSPEINALLTSLLYQFSYDWSALPADSAYPWTKSYSAVASEDIVTTPGSLIMVDGDSPGRIYYSRETNNVSASDIVIFENRCSTNSILTGTNAPVVLRVYDGSKQTSVQINTTTLYVGGVSKYTADFTTPKTITVVRNKQLMIYVFVDGVLICASTDFVDSAIAPTIYFGLTHAGVTMGTMTSEWVKYSLIKEGARKVVGTEAQFDDININGNLLKNSATNGALNLESNGSANINLTAGTSGEIICKGKVNPQADNIYSLGKSGARYSEVWAANGVIQTSDLSYKTEISPGDLGLDFINKIKPVSFRWIDGKRRHYGIVAQQLESILDSKDFAAFIRDKTTGECGIRYHELMAPLIKAVQELDEKIQAFENRRFSNRLRLFINKLLAYFNFKKSGS